MISYTLQQNQLRPTGKLCHAEQLHTAAQLHNVIQNTNPDNDCLDKLAITWEEKQTAAVTAVTHRHA